MEKTKLQLDETNAILRRLENTKVIVEKQTAAFQRLLLGKISEEYKEIDQERLQGLITRNFTSLVCDELDYLFKNYEEQELAFYDKNLKTADLIFNTLSDKRTQRIYLENLIKKINQKEDDISDVFTVSAKNKFEENETDKYLSLNEIFDNFTSGLVHISHIPSEELGELCQMAIHYYNLFQADMVSALEKFLNENKEQAIIKMETIMDKKEIGNGKTSAMSKLEKSITTNSIRAMEQLLEKTINKNKESSLKELKICSSSMVDLIFKFLPSEYHDQKELLEVIVDTNINERLGKLLETETKKLVINLNSKNQDIVENELYEEKRYKQHEEYQADLGLVGVVYQSVLHEISIAYDIPEEDQNSKRLKLVVLSECDSTKSVFKKYFEQVKLENQQNLNAVVVEMHNLSDKAKKESVQENNMVLVKK